MKMMIDNIKLALLFTILLSVFSYPAYAGAINSQVIVGCTVIRGSHKAELGVKCNLPTKGKMVTRLSTQPNYVADYKVYCPKGDSVTITKEVKYYEYSQDNRLVKVGSAIDPADTLYTDEQCTEVWDPKQKTTFRPTKDNESYRGALYCKKTIKDKKDSDKKFVVVEFTVFY